MLLYSMLHLAGVKAVNSEYEAWRAGALPLDDIKNFRPARQQMPRPSGIPLDLAALRPRPGR